jgi:uncharacterized protein (DUF427 family)
MWKHTGQMRPSFALEPGPGQESVWDYPRPPRLDADNRPVLVKSGAQELASTQSSYRLCETASPPTFYLPPSSVAWDHLVPAPGASLCEWKGQAQYWAVAEQPQVAVAWNYPDPRGPYAALKDHMAFYPALVECWVAGERVQPQPGRFYGGWITSELVGPFKGEPGTGHW